MTTHVGRNVVPSQRTDVEISRSMLVQRVIAYIDENFCKAISLRDVANALGYSHCYLTTAFREATGVPVTAWIIRRRIEAARAFLQEPHVKIATVCEKVGFMDQCYFTRQFVRHVGTTPGKFRSREASMTASEVPTPR
ncbi:MAG: helix-turn-helix transcriptional regulator [Candidatus Eremiobacteraeota bacterium]|nr:helix-turn-helix transcriptional regulator [Candidatus Eremiobacteraeota bacterium]